MLPVCQAYPPASLRARCSKQFIGYLAQRTPGHERSRLPLAAVQGASVVTPPCPQMAYPSIHPTDLVLSEAREDNAIKNRIFLYMVPRGRA